MVVGVQGLGCRGWGLGCRVWRVKGLGLRVWGLAFRFLWFVGLGFRFSVAFDLHIEAQRLQCPLIKEYSVNHIRDPTIFYGIP